MPPIKRELNVEDTSYSQPSKLMRMNPGRGRNAVLEEQAANKDTIIRTLRGQAAIKDAQLYNFRVFVIKNHLLSFEGLWLEIL